MKTMKAMKAKGGKQTKGKGKGVKDGGSTEQAQPKGKAQAPEPLSQERADSMSRALGHEGEQVPKRKIERKSSEATSPQKKSKAQPENETALGAVASGSAEAEPTQAKPKSKAQKADTSDICAGLHKEVEVINESDLEEEDVGPAPKAQPQPGAVQPKILREQCMHCKKPIFVGQPEGPPQPVKNRHGQSYLYYKHAACDSIYQLYRNRNELKPYKGNCLSFEQKEIFYNKHGGIAANMAVDIKAKFTEAHSEVRSNTARSFAEGWTEAELSDKYLEPKGKWAGTTAQPERFHAIIANAPRKRNAAQGCTFYFPEEMSIESKKIVTDSELSENIAEQGTRRKPCRPAIQGGPAQPSPAKAAKDPKDPKPLTEGQKTNLRKSKHQWEAMLADYTKMMGDTDWAVSYTHLTQPTNYSV